MPTQVVLLAEISCLRSTFKAPFQVWGQPTRVELVFTNLTQDGQFDELIGTEFCVPVEWISQESRNQIESVMSGKIQTDIEGVGDVQSLTMIRKARENMGKMHIAFAVDPRVVSTPS